ncbi:MAG TPA: methyltransferase domain-containing protein [Candidatus Dormibacteraeota bacterium]|nr:methyltransferase domain-containing protein [Candidatus Dormibacteraeota bacterium]
MTSVDAPSGAFTVVLRDPSGGGVAGRWEFGEGDGPLLIDAGGESMCTAPGRDVRAQWVRAGFVPYPRMTFEVGGRPVEVVSAEASVIARHYGRSGHQESLYAARGNPWIEAYHRARLRQVRRLLDGVRGVVADVGAGHSLVAAAGPWPFRLVACDVDREAVASMRSRGIEAVLASAQHVPFARGSVDAVFAGEIVEHLSAPHEAMAQWVGLLRPGGRLVVTTPNRRHLLTRVRGHEVVENPEHLFEWSCDELCDAVRRAGATVVRVEGMALPVPVFVPRHGWRDLVQILPPRVHVPDVVLSRAISLGRRVPALAANMAVVARRG